MPRPHLAPAPCLRLARHPQTDPLRGTGAFNSAASVSHICSPQACSVRQAICLIVGPASSDGSGATQRCADQAEPRPALTADWTTAYRGR